MKQFFVERYWLGRTFCWSRIVDEDGVELTGYKHYGKRPSHDSRLHREVDYAIREILKEATGRTVGSAYIDAAIVLKHLREYYEDCKWKNKHSYRVLIIKNWLNEKAVDNPRK